MRWWLFFIYFLLLFSSITGVQASLCSRILANEWGKPLADSTQIKSRMEQVLAHQNALVKRLAPAQGLLKIENLGMNLLSENSHILIIKEAEGDARFLAVGDLILRLQSQNPQLDTAYQFHGAELNGSVSFGAFVLDAMPDVVTLIRNMDRTEFHAWQSRKESIIGETVARNRGSIDFNLGNRSWVGSHLPFATEWTIPRTTLLLWLAQGWVEIKVASIHPLPSGQGSLAIDFAFQNPVWGELGRYYSGLSKEQASLGMKFKSLHHLLFPH